MRRTLGILMLGCVAGCNSRSTSVSASGGDASAQRSVTVHVPGALRVARAIDSLSAEIDPASRADVTVSIDPRMTIGVETESRVFRAGDSNAIGSARHARASGGDFDVGAATWTSAVDSLPRIDEKYVVEMDVVLFETDVPPGPNWDPHAGHYETLLARSLRQAEE